MSFCLIRLQLEYAKKYENEIEERKRLLIFMENQEKINQHNQRYANDDVSFKLAINEYGDLTHAEFLNRNNCLNYSRHLK